MSIKGKGILGVAVLIAAAVLFGYFADSAWAQRPALTRDVDNGDRMEILNRFIMLGILDGDQDDLHEHCYSVPAGKRWIIEQVSIRGFIPIGQERPLVMMKVLADGSTIAEHVLNAMQKLYTTSVDETWVINQPVRIRVPAGNELCIDAHRYARTDRVDLFMQVIGYVIDYP